MRQAVPRPSEGSLRRAATLLKLPTQQGRAFVAMLGDGPCGVQCAVVLTTLISCRHLYLPQGIR